MATHHGGKVGAAAKTLASSSTSKAAKSAAAKEDSGQAPDCQASLVCEQGVM